MKYGLSFTLEKRKTDGVLNTEMMPILADIRYAGRRYFYYTGYRVDLAYFDEKKQEVKKNKPGFEGKREVSYSDINRRLKNIEAVLQLHFDKVSSTNNRELKYILDKTINKSQSLEKPVTDPSNFSVLAEKYILTAKVGDARRKQLKSMINRWKDYEERKNIKLSFRDISVDKLREFEEMLKSEERGINTVSTIMKKARAFFNFAYNELDSQGIHLDNPFKKGYSIPSEIYGNPIYISIEERDHLFNLHIPNQRLEKVRDLFVLQCLLGMRIADYLKLTKEHVQGGYIVFIAGKTKEKNPRVIRVPLHPKAIEIISRYDLPDGRLMPFISAEKYRIYIKELFRFAQLTRIVTRLNTKTRMPEQVRLCEIASTHMARKTFIGGLYKRKVKDSIIATMSGHAPGSKAFARYYNIDDEMIEEAINTI